MMRENIYRDLANELIEMVGAIPLGVQFYHFADVRSVEMRTGENVVELGQRSWAAVVTTHRQALLERMTEKRGWYHFPEFDPAALAAMMPEVAHRVWPSVNMALLIFLTDFLPPEHHLSFRGNLAVTASPKTVLNQWFNWYDEVKVVDPEAAKAAIYVKLRLDAFARVASLIPSKFDAGSVATLDGSSVRRALDALSDPAAMA